MRISSAHRRDKTINCCAAVVIWGRVIGPGVFHIRNGGRHRCQPPLRRAKDLPNFPSQVPGEPYPRISAHQLRRRLPSDCLLRGRNPIALPRCTGPKTRFRFDPPGLAKPEPSDVPRPFLGWPRFAFRFAHQRSEDLREPRPATERPSLPAPLPGWPRKAPRGTFQLPAGGDRILGHLPHRHSVSGFPMRPGPPSRSPMHNALLARVGEAK